MRAAAAGACGRGAHVQSYNRSVVQSSELKIGRQWCSVGTWYISQSENTGIETKHAYL